jgi:hypothetical protein
MDAKRGLRQQSSTASRSTAAHRSGAMTGAKVRRSQVRYRGGHGRAIADG